MEIKKKYEGLKISATKGKTRLVGKVGMPREG